MQVKFKLKIILSLSIKTLSNNALKKNQRLLPQQALKDANYLILKAKYLLLFQFLLKKMLINQQATVSLFIMPIRDKLSKRKNTNLQ